MKQVINARRTDPMMKMELTQDILKELLTYNPDTGVFTWNYRDRKWFHREMDYKTWNTRYAFKPTAIYINSHGYRLITIFKKIYKAHRLALLYVHGLVPNEVDHIDGDRQNNCLNNLRCVDRLANSKNLGIRNNNTSGYIGVDFHKIKNKWRSRIFVNGIEKSLGYFDSLEDAVIARERANIFHGFHDNHGKRSGFKSNV